MKKAILNKRMMQIGSLAIIFVFALSQNAVAKKKPVASYYKNAEFAKARLMAALVTEVEEELEVADLVETSKLIPGWMFVEKENELAVSFVDVILEWYIIEAEVVLEVEDFISTEEIIPFWMIIQKEPELEVLEL